MSDRKCGSRSVIVIRASISASDRELTSLNVLQIIWSVSVGYYPVLEIDTGFQFLAKQVDLVEKEDHVGVFQKLV